MKYALLFLSLINTYFFTFAMQNDSAYQLDLTKPDLRTVFVNQLWEPVVVLTKRIDLLRTAHKEFHQSAYTISAQLFLERIFKRRPELLQLSCVQFVQQEPKLTQAILACTVKECSAGMRSLEFEFVHMFDQIRRLRETELARFQTNFYNSHHSFY